MPPKRHRPSSFKLQEKTWIFCIAKVKFPAPCKGKFAHISEASKSYSSLIADHLLIFGHHTRPWSKAVSRKVVSDLNSFWTCSFILNKCSCRAMQQELRMLSISEEVSRLRPSKLYGQGLGPSACAAIDNPERTSKNNNEIPQEESLNAIFHVII